MLLFGLFLGRAVCRLPSGCVRAVLLHARYSYFNVRRVKHLLMRQHDNVYFLSDTAVSV